MSRKSLRQNQYLVEEPTINLTPLIDVVFVILIMFILIAPLLELDHIELASSSSDPGEHSSGVYENSPIAIHVYRDNSVWLNKERIKLSQVSQALKKIKESHPNAKPQLFHDKQAHFGTYQAIKNAAESVGYREMDVILKPD